MPLMTKAERAFYIIVVRHSIVGCGVPVAFMIRSSETRFPLELWLKWLIGKSPLTETPNFMIECSMTEFTGIKAAFDYPNMRFCHWHFFRTLNAQTKKIINLVVRKSVIAEFISLVRKISIYEFN